MLLDPVSDGIFHKWLQHETWDEGLHRLWLRGNPYPEPIGEADTLDAEVALQKRELFPQ